MVLKFIGSMSSDQEMVHLLEKIRNGPKIICGSKEAREEFDLDENYRNLNHGSFGVHPRAVKAMLRHYQDQADAHPDVYIRYELPKLLDQSRETVAKLINAAVDDCVYVQNATTAFNVILRNLEFKSGDVIIYPPTIYGGIEKTVLYITETTPAECHRLEYALPRTDDEICAAFEDAFRANLALGKIPKIAVFDTICSAPGVRMPFERLTALCRRYGVLSCIDGAHSIGQIPLDLKLLDPDFFFSNAHKWLHVPRASCIFHVPQRHQAAMRSTLPTSHGFEPRPVEGRTAIVNPLPPSTKSHFVTNFEFVGTLDTNAYICAPAALLWRQRLVWNGQEGEAAIMAYLQHLARRIGKQSSAILGTEVLENAQGTLGNCAFANVRLPLSYEDDADADLATAIQIAQWITNVLVVEYNTFVAIMWHADTWWVRWSAQVYLDEEVFTWGSNRLKEVCMRARAGEWKS